MLAATEVVEAFPEYEHLGAVLQFDKVLHAVSISRNLFLGLELGGELYIRCTQMEISGLRLDIGMGSEGGGENYLAVGHF